MDSVTCATFSQVLPQPWRQVLVIKEEKHSGLAGPAVQRLNQYVDGSLLSVNKVPTWPARCFPTTVTEEKKKTKTEQTRSSGVSEKVPVLVITTAPESRGVGWGGVFEAHKAQSLQVNSVPTVQLVLWTWRHLFPHFTVGLLNCHLLLAAAAAAAAPLLGKNLVLHDTDVGQVARWKTHCLWGFFLRHSTQLRRALGSPKRQRRAASSCFCFSSWPKLHLASRWGPSRLSTSSYKLNILMTSNKYVKIRVMDWKQPYKLALMMGTSHLK